MKYFLAFVAVLHGLIHLVGFAKAFHYASFDALTKEISRPVGLVWLLAGVLFIGASAQLLAEIRLFWVTLLMAVAISQTLVFLHWTDARFASVINIFLLLVVAVGYASWRFENQFKHDVANRLSTHPNTGQVLSEKDMQHLPDPVQRYIRHSGAYQQSKIQNWKMEFSGRIRKDEQAAWMPFTTEQYNFVDPPARLFFMKARMFGLPVYGYHAFADGKATMDVRLFSLFSVQFQQGAQMDQAETVTWLNDLCLYAPGALIDNRIVWEAIDAQSARATFSDHGITISAILYFNEKSELVDFVSNDRYFTSTQQQLVSVPFSTPVKNYVEMQGHRVPAYGEAVWKFKEQAFCYGQFHLKSIDYNVKN